MSIDLKNLTLKKALTMMESGELTSEALVTAYIEQIQKVNGEVNAYLEVYADAIEQAKKADEVRASYKAGNKDSKIGNNDASSPLPALLGIPCALKDNITIQGKRVGASSKILDTYIAPYDATVITKLKSAGVVFIGRVNMDEFAMGGSTENSAYGTTKNPHDHTRVAGGSSGGSAASVAMDGALFALGSDTGGSIRQPASYCGVVGLKPTYGRVSRHGLMAMGSSLDVIGPITKTVEDAELAFNAMKGGQDDRSDRYDSTSVGNTEAIGRADEHARSLSGKLRIGIVPELMNIGGIDPVVADNLTKSIEILKNAGCEVQEVHLPHIKYSLAVYYILMPAEVSSNMARFDGVKYGSHIDADTNLLGDYLATRGELLGKEVRRRIMLGTYVLSSGYHDAYYNKANIVKELIAEDFKKAFEDVDVILTPTAPTPAFKIGSHTSDPIQMYLEDIFTVTANLIGVPAISVPSGFVEVDADTQSGAHVVDGKVKLPLGIQFTAPHCREDILFEVGKLYEDASR